MKNETDDQWHNQLQTQKFLYNYGSLKKQRCLFPTGLPDEHLIRTSKLHQPHYSQESSDASLHMLMGTTLLYLCILLLTILMGSPENAYEELNTEETNKNGPKLSN